MNELKKLRQERNLTQAQFAEWLEIPKRTYEKWETGERTPPTWVVKLIEFKCKKSTQGEQIKIEDIEKATALKEKFHVLHTKYCHGYETYRIYKENDPFYSNDIKFRQSEDKKEYRFTPEWETFEVYKI